MANQELKKSVILISHNYPNLDAGMRTEEDVIPIALSSSQRVAMILLTGCVAFSSFVHNPLIHEEFKENIRKTRIGKVVGIVAKNDNLKTHSIRVNGREPDDPLKKEVPSGEPKKEDPNIDENGRADRKAQNKNRQQGFRVASRFCARAP